MSFLLKAGIRLEDLSPAEAGRIALEDVVLLRRELFARCIATVDDGPIVRVGDAGEAQSCRAHLEAWAARMTAQHGAPHIQVHQVPDLPWLTALMVVMWGEAPITDNGAGGWRRVWPNEWSAAFIARALAWESGQNIPQAVQPGAAIVGAPRPRIVRADLTAANA